jgi:hypothetical protein
MGRVLPLCRERRALALDPLEASISMCTSANMGTVFVCTKPSFRKRAREEVFVSKIFALFWGGNEQELSVKKRRNNTTNK